MTTLPSRDYSAAQAFGAPAAPGVAPRWLIAVAGALSIIAGLAALLWPRPTLLVVGLLFGISIGVAGAALMVAGLTHPGATTGRRVLNIAMGIVGVLAGLALVVRPEASVATVALILGFWCVLRGVTHLVLAVEREGRWVNVLRGVIGIAAGVIILASPEIGIGTIVLVVGVTLICHGLLELMMAFTDLGEAA